MFLEQLKQLKYRSRMPSIECKIILIPLKLSFLKALTFSPADFKNETGLSSVEDWPNAEFLDAVPFFIDARRENPEAENWSFLVVRDIDQTVVGEIGAKDIASDLEAIEVGYGIAKSCRGLGYASAALQCFLELAISRGVGTLTAECLKTNTASIRTLEKCRFSVVGERASDEGNLFLWHWAK